MPLTPKIESIRTNWTDVIRYIFRHMFARTIGYFITENANKKLRKPFIIIRKSYSWTGNPKLPTNVCVCQDLWISAFFLRASFPKFQIICQIVAQIVADFSNLFWCANCTHTGDSVHTAHTLQNYVNCTTCGIIHTVRTTHTPKRKQNFYRKSEKSRKIPDLGIGDHVCFKL